MKPQLQLTLTWSITSVRNSTKPAHCCGGSFKADSVNETDNSYTEEGCYVPTCFQVKVTQMGLGLENLDPFVNEWRIFIKLAARCFQYLSVYI